MAGECDVGVACRTICSDVVGVVTGENQRRTGPCVVTWFWVSVHQKLLKGRTADEMVTSDTPGWYDRVMLSRCMRVNITKQILGFCGIKTKKYRHIAVVKLASEKEIQLWIAQARVDGVAAAKRNASKALALAPAK